MLLTTLILLTGSLPNVQKVSLSVNVGYMISLVLDGVGIYMNFKREVA